MSISRRGRSLAVRWATGLGVLTALPFLASGVAQAAMAGGNPLSTTNRPDLRTVHVNNGASSAQFCFDKDVANSSPQGGTLMTAAPDFSLGGYRYDVQLTGATANVDTSNTKCVVVNFAGTHDLTSYSFGSVDDNTVVANAGGAAAPGNIGDSTANLDSTAHSGTADHTQGPDLQAVVGDPTNNRLNYVFDQPVDSTTTVAGRYLFYDSNGNPHWGAPIGTSGTVVSVQFATTDSVSTAQQAVVIRGTPASEGQPQAFFNNCTNGNGAVCESGGFPETIAPTESAAVPGNSGLTARPVLQSAALVPGPSNQIDYTFSTPISAGTASDLVAVTSNGQEVQANSETIIGTNTVRATFSTFEGLQSFQELIVKASAYGCISGEAGCVDFATNNPGNGAVQSVNLPAGAQTRFNLTGGVQVGDNAGAFSTGYSTGPDARSVTFNNTSGTVTVQMDQRVDPSEGLFTAGCLSGVFLSGGCWVLLDNTGAVVDPSPSSAAIVNNSPFQSQVVLTYPPSDLARAGSLAIAGAPFDDSAACSSFSEFQFEPQCTVRQVISPTASANAFIDPAKGKVSTKWHWVSKKQVNRALARLRAAQKRAHNHKRAHRHAR